VGCQYETCDNCHTPDQLCAWLGGARFCRWCLQIALDNLSTREVQEAQRRERGDHERRI
jgi:hypothetical protein